MKSAIFAAVLISLFSLSILSVPVSAGNYMNFYTSSVVQPGQKINITGNVYNADNTSQIIPNINVSAIINNTINSTASNVGYTGNFTLFAPNSTGEYNVTIYSNDSAIMNKTFTVYVSNVTGGNITYIGLKPPFTAGATFTINVTLANYSAAVANYTPRIKIFAANGPENGSISGWVIRNLTPKSDGSGRIQYNITVPSAADGQYIIALEYGMIYNIFSIKAGYSASGVTYQGGDDSQLSANYYPGENMSLLVKVKDLNGNPVNTSNITAVIAYITYPNNTVTNVTLDARNQTTYPGYFNDTFTTDTSQQGQYKVRYDINTTEGKTIQTYTIFNTKQLNVKVQSNKDFFMEWGGSASFRPADTAVLNVIVTNLTDESMLLNTTPGGKLNCGNVSITTFWNTSDNTQFSISGAVAESGNYLSNQICRIRFTTPSKSGVYGVRVNVTVGSVRETGEGYFAVQNYIVKGSASSELGGEGDFETMAYPGDNATVNIKAYNLSSNSEVSGSLIQNISVTKIVPLEFAAGMSEITNVTYSVDYSGSSPVMKVGIPEITGPLMVEFRANISGEIVVGNVFFIANYLNGFLGPSKGSEFGGSSEGDFMPFASCTSNTTMTFKGMISDVKSGTAVQGVSVGSISVAREEMTGKSIAPYLNFISSTTSDNRGAISVNVTLLPGYDFQEFNFIIFNASYKGKNAGIPSFFMCKKYNFWPQISSAGKQGQTWRIAPASGVTVKIQNAQRLDNGRYLDNRTNISLPRIMVFSPSKGGMSMLLPKDGTNNFLANFIHTDMSGNYMAANITLNNVNITIYPQNFTLDGNNITSWPSGFVDLQPRVCGALGCDTTFGGFEVVAFDVWPNSWLSTASAGQNVSLNISARTNVANVTTGGNNITVKVGRPWEGQLFTANVTSARLLEDTWNNSNHTGQEIWEVNFTIPQQVKKGYVDITLTVNSSSGETSDLHMGAQISKYSVFVGVEEGIGDPSFSRMDGYYINFTTEANTTQYGRWDTSVLNVSSQSGRVCVKMQFNSTRYGQEGQTGINYTAIDGTKLMVLDRAVANVYDTIILNRSGTIVVANMTSRNMTQVTPQGALHLWKIEDCGYAKIVNSSSSLYTQNPNSWGGEYQVRTNFSLPYVVIANNRPMSGVTVGINGIANQSGGFSGQGGFGFEGKLQTTDYSVISVNTGADGLAFVAANISKAGRFRVFWKVSTSANSADTDIADFQTATDIDVKSFKGWGDASQTIPLGKVTLFYQSNNRSVWNAFQNASTLQYGTEYVYSGTVQETAANDFVRDSQTSNWSIVYNPNATSTNSGLAMPGMLKIDDDGDFSDADTGSFSVNSLNGASGARYLNESFDIQGFGAANGQKVAVSAYLNWTNSTGLANNITFVFYQREPGAATNNMFTVANATQNITIKVCAETYDKPNSKPIPGANVTELFVNEWGMMGPTKRQLQMYDPVNDTAVDRVQIGPNGCSAIKAGPRADGLTQWARGQTVWVQGTIQNNTNTESFFATGVWRSW